MLAGLLAALLAGLLAGWLHIRFVQQDVNDEICVTEVAIRFAPQNINNKIRVTEYEYRPFSADLWHQLANSWTQSVD